MTEERKCYIHNTPTRLSCGSCGKPICPKCMVNAHIGYRCKECGQRNITHIEKITPKQYLLGTIVGLIVGTIIGLIWSYLSKFGALITLFAAYGAGSVIALSISKVIGNKIGLKVQAFVGIIVIISLFYNPVTLVTTSIMYHMPIIPCVAYLTTINTACIIKIIGGVLAVWAATRYFKV